jgi:DNA polymerase elongation subunit (family B)
VVNNGYEKALLLVTKAIHKIMTGEDLDKQDLVISKLLRQDINKYKSLFPHVYAAIQLSDNSKTSVLLLKAILFNIFIQIYSIPVGFMLT